MDGDQSGHAERHDRQSAHRAVIAIGLLAVGLAGRSFTQSAAWASEMAVWAQAQRVAPHRPDVWIEHAMAVLNLPGDPTDRSRLAMAERDVRKAQRVASQQQESEQRWTVDASAATLAVIRMRQGRLLDAAHLMAHAREYTARGQLCAHFRSVCALAD